MHQFNPERARSLYDEEDRATAQFGSDDMTDDELVAEVLRLMSPDPEVPPVDRVAWAALYLMDTDDLPMALMRTLWEFVQRSPEPIYDPSRDV